MTGKDRAKEDLIELIDGDVRVARAATRGAAMV